MNSFNGGGGASRNQRGYVRSHTPDGADEALCTHRSVGVQGQVSREPNARASTYTPEEATFAERYAREQMADAAPTTDRHYRSMQ